jgi:membrane peptidoglycan carboxypeptidase
MILCQIKASHRMDTRRRRFVALAAAALILYAAAAWLLLLPPTALPPAVDFARLPPGTCADPAFAAALGRRHTILYVPLTQVPTALVDQLRRREDGFYHHRGVDWTQVLRALAKDVAAGEYRYGASTVTMQLMRELHLGKQRTLLRKVREMAYALQAERRMSKEQILELYLNVVDWGAGLRGVGAASCYYFGRAPASLEPGEAIRLVSILPSPDRLGPSLKAWADWRRQQAAAAAPAAEAR